MDKRLEKLLSKEIQNQKLKIVFLIIVVVLQSLFSLIYPLIKQVYDQIDISLPLSTRLLLLLLPISLFGIIQWGLGK